MREASPAAAPSSAPAVAPAFRQAMRRLAATVSVISLGHPDGRHGITATAVTSLSMEPPALLVCVNQAGFFHRLLEQETRFCVNLLHSEHADVGLAFAGSEPADRRFARGDWDEDADGVPFLRNAQANLFCDKDRQIAYGSHSIFIGSVRRVDVREDIAPLIYQDGAFLRPEALPGSPG